MSDEKKDTLHHAKLDYKPIHTDGLDKLLRDDLGENYTGMSINEAIGEFLLHFKEEPNKHELAHALGLIQDHDAEVSRATFAPPKSEVDELRAEVERLKAQLRGDV